MRYEEALEALMMRYCNYLMLSHAVVRTGAIRIGMLDD